MRNGSASWPLKLPNKTRWIFENKILTNWSMVSLKAYLSLKKTLTCNVKRWFFVSYLAKSLQYALKWKLQTLLHKVLVQDSSSICRTNRDNREPLVCTVTIFSVVFRCIQLQITYFLWQRKRRLWQNFYQKARKPLIHRCSKRFTM